MDDLIKVDLRGLEDVKAALRSLTPQLRYRMLRNALAAGARIVRDETRRAAPVLTPENAKRNRYRKQGTLRNAITVRTSGRDKRAGNVGVFVNVRPAKGAARGARNPNDPYYWLWSERGTRQRFTKGKQMWSQSRGAHRGKRGNRGRMPAFRFLQKAAGSLDKALPVIIDRLRPEIVKLNRRR